MYASDAEMELVNAMLSGFSKKEVRVLLRLYAEANGMEDFKLRIVNHFMKTMGHWCGLKLETLALHGRDSREYKRMWNRVGSEGGRLHRCLQFWHFMAVGKLTMERIRLWQNAGR